MGIESVCPKCGEIGRQSVFSPKKNKPELTYLRFLHGKNRQCFVGKVRTLEEAMGEFDKPTTKQEYEVVLRNLSTELKAYAKLMLNTYRPFGKNIYSDIHDILVKYGQW